MTEGTHFNPPTPWGVGLTVGVYGYIVDGISIHPLRGEWDFDALALVFKCRISIHPLRGEWDEGGALAIIKVGISIHPLRGEWD